MVSFPLKTYKWPCAQVPSITSAPDFKESRATFELHRPQVGRFSLFQDEVKLFGIFIIDYS